MRGARCAIAACIACLLTAAGAAATPQVKLNVRFSPDTPGRSTTIYYGFNVSEPAPLRSMELRLPAGMGFTKASLGLEECTASVLRERGPRGCPPDSLVGFGAAYAEVPAQETIKEHAELTVLLGPTDNKGRPTMLFFVEGIYPASEELALSSDVLAAAAPFGYALRTELPLLRSWPGGPYIAITRLRTTIGPHGLHYYYRQGTKRIEFTPRGLNVPERCPRGGYPVQARFSWWGIAGTARTTTRVACGHTRAGAPSRAPAPGVDSSPSRPSTSRSGGHRHEADRADRARTAMAPRVVSGRHARPCRRAFSFGAQMRLDGEHVRLR